MDEAVEAAFRAIWEREPIRGTGDDGRLAAMARALSAADAARAAVDERWQLVDRICRTVFPDFDHWPDRTARHGMRHTVFRALAAAESDNG